MQKVIKKLPVLFFVTALTAAFVLVPDVTSKGVSDGISLCLQIVIPSLFPFMILSCFIIKSGISEQLGAILEPLTRCIFRLPGVAGAVIIMGFIGGYPIGAKMAAQLYDSGKISENQAQRMMMFCINAGPAFILSAVGNFMLHSRKAGAIIFISVCISSLLVGFLTRFVESSGDEIIIENENEKKLSNETALVDSVAEASNAIFSVCSWIIVFSCISSLTDLLSEKFSTLSLTLKCFLEVTAGCNIIAKSSINIAFIAAVLGFAGFSVHFQILPYLKKVKLKYRIFFASRVITGAISALISCQIFKMFPCNISVSANLMPPIPEISQYSVPAAIGLLLMGAFLIIDLDINKRLC